jgi:putative DNA primase/helicase
MGADEGLSAARKVWRWIERQRLETFTARDCFQALKGTFARMGNLRPAFDVLIERHYIFPLEKEQSGPGRPSEVFYINPKIVGGWS